MSWRFLPRLARAGVATAGILCRFGIHPLIAHCPPAGRADERIRSSSLQILKFESTNLRIKCTILVVEALRDDRHLFVMPVAGAECLQLAPWITIALASDMRHIRSFCDAVDAMATGALSCHCASDRGITAGDRDGGRRTDQTNGAERCRKKTREHVSPDLTVTDCPDNGCRGGSLHYSTLDGLNPRTRSDIARLCIRQQRTCDTAAPHHRWLYSAGTVEIWWHHGGVAPDSPATI